MPSLHKDSKIIIIGAGVFGLTTARELALQGFSRILVLDRHVPPVPDGSSTDISRVIRFDYADQEYLEIALEAYRKWSTEPRYHGIFEPSPFILTNNEGVEGQASEYIRKTTAALTKLQLPWTELPDAAAAKRIEPVLTGQLASPNFYGYHNHQAGWADAAKAMLQLRDDCIQLGISFICGGAGTVVGFDADSNHEVTAVRTLEGTTVAGDHFVLAGGAWSSSLVDMYNSTLSTGQVLGYMLLTDAEMQKYAKLPIYINFSTGWFNFPPHGDTKLLKMAVHGWGYTRAPTANERSTLRSDISSPPLQPSRERPNFVPNDGEDRLRDGLREILPELADRPFERLALCWYTDTPTGDFIMDYHPDYRNLFIAGGGSGHAFKFLPVLGEYTTLALKRQLAPNLSHKWRFHREWQDQADIFRGDGSRGGPERRELRPEERAKL